MHCRLIAVALLAAMSLATGCSICQAPDDYTYGYYGGLYQRPDPVHGRAGTIVASGEEMVAEEAMIEGEIVEGDGWVAEEVPYYEEVESY